MNEANSDVLWAASEDTEKSGNSAFREPSVLDVAEVQPPLAQTATKGKKEKKAKDSGAGKPNFVLLGFAGVLLTGIVAGGGLFLKDKFFPSASSRAPVEMQEVQEMASTEPASLFDLKKTHLLEPAVPSAPASAASTEIPAAAASVPAPVPAAAASAPVPAAKAVAAESVKTDDKAPNTHARKGYGAQAKHEKHAASQRTAAAKRKKVHLAQSGEKAQEVFMLTNDLKLKAIYPPTGANVQAWISNDLGHTQIVRVGDTLRGGAKVVAIVAEKGLVKTNSGVITSRGIE